MEGLRVACIMQPDLGVLELPVLLPDGRTLTETLKNECKTAAIPILTVTSHAMPDEIERARNAGSDLCLTKPVIPNGVIRAVEQLLAPPLVR